MLKLAIVVEMLKIRHMKIVSSGLSGHAESIEVIYDENKIDYEQILRFF